MTDVQTLVSDLTDIKFDLDPVTPTVLGLSGGRDALLPDHREEATDAVRSRLVDLAARAAKLDTTNLDAQDRITVAVVRQQTESILETQDLRLTEFTITDSFFAHAGELLFILPLITLPSENQAEDYLRRLEAIPDFLSALADRHRAGIAGGRTPVAHLVSKTIELVDRYLADPASDPLLRPKPAEPNADFEDRRKQILADRVHPAFADYRAVLADEVLSHGRPLDKVGLCWLPDGETTYRALAKSHTTTDRTPAELHQVGLDLIADLGREYRELGAKVFGTDDLAEIFDRLRTDPALRWSDGDELLDAARAAITRAEAVAPDWFGRLPSEQCRVEPVPEAEAPGAVGAYYMSGSLDGSRVGTYYANTYEAGERFRYTAEATAFHEAVPGHHFQITIAQELSDLPLIRRIAPLNAYLEGWGLYTERLADEMGLYSDDLAKFGMLTLDSMRAGRLVVDTGLHTMGWSRQQAVDYLIENTAMAPLEIEGEVDRYIAAPGQALSYMVGRLEINRLRSRAETELGERFDISAFHDAMLGSGALPLTVLDELIGDWIAAQQS
ncbi:DUF885 domain-containing protein [Actinoalloteichus hymeniacidonis]|uniref:DUF885 domain-containing protein n=1 Tax=Actinoalloteichus hymeniacidonis TaxID=340345 RepID=A0AAC9HLR7_9PSEU|nr:DUF885 domain-containing protein [Actinoalloteichus hymeniacidonis]AOS61464.1 hypothetical protein TL08_03150 [Actinoalloteichus hymeniacidonis]MBB5910529.1 uncharacterized protein (DUF885 family) [Actinoalloteichus hymeniacidonis]